MCHGRQSCRAACVLTLSDQFDASVFESVILRLILHAMHRVDSTLTAGLFPVRFDSCDLMRVVGCVEEHENRVAVAGIER